MSSRAWVKLARSRSILLMNMALGIACCDSSSQKVSVMEARIQETDATKLLDEIKQLTYKRKFARAIELIGRFEEEFPDSVQIGRKEKLKADALKKRHAFYQQKILTDFRAHMDPDQLRRKLGLSRMSWQETEPKLVRLIAPPLGEEEESPP